MPGLRPRWPGGARGRRWAGSVGRRLEWHGARSRCGPHPFGDLNCRVHLPPGLPPCDRIPRPPFVRPPLPNSRNRWRGPDLPMASVRKTASHWLRLRLSWRRGARGRRWGGHLRRRCGGRCWGVLERWLPGLPGHWGGVDRRGREPRGEREQRRAGDTVGCSRNARIRQPPAAGGPVYDEAPRVALEKCPQPRRRNVRGEEIPLPSWQGARDDPPLGCLHVRSSETTSSSRNAASPANGGHRCPSGGAGYWPGGGTSGGARPTTHSQGSTWQLGRALRSAKTACAASRMISTDSLPRLKHLGEADLVGRRPKRMHR